MAHELAMINGKPAMAYVGRKPWHNLGAQLETAPETAAELIVAAQLNWLVEKKPIYAFDYGNLAAIPGYYATYRADLWGKEGGKPFGLVGEDYQVLQNHEAFRFFDDLIGIHGVSYETAGALGQGERVWVLAKLKDPMVVAKVDHVERYLLLSNGHNGRTALQVRFTPIRVVCQNTLNGALLRGGDLMKSHHGHGMNRRLEDARQTVKRLLGCYDDLSQHFNRLAGKQIDTTALRTYLGEVFPEPKRRRNQTERSHLQALARVHQVRETGAQLFDHGIGNAQPQIRHTLWTAYNAVTELVDHHWAYEDAWQRMSSICFGEGEQIKSRALDAAIALARN